MAHCFCHTHLIVLSNDLPRFYKEVIRFLSKHNNIQCSWVILRLHTAILEYWMNSCFHSVFQVSADLAFHQSWDVRPILPNFPWNMVSVSLADYQFLSLWHQPFFQSLSAFVHLPCYQPGSFNPGVQPRHSRCWLVFIILAWSARYPNYTPGTPCAWSWMCVTGRYPNFLWGIYSENHISVPGSLSASPPELPS